MNWVFYLFLMRLIDVISRQCIVYVFTQWHTGIFRTSLKGEIKLK